MAYFKRTALANEMAQKLLHPGILEQTSRSGLFISGHRRTGKTTFLRQDLIPALERGGAIVIYADLWSDTKADPASLVHDAVRQFMASLQTPGVAILERLKRLKGIDMGAAGFKHDLRKKDASKTLAPWPQPSCTDLCVSPIRQPCECQWWVDPIRPPQRFPRNEPTARRRRLPSRLTHRPGSRVWV